jgi:hypothetical protein
VPTIVEGYLFTPEGTVDLPRPLLVTQNQLSLPAA